MPAGPFASEDDILDTLGRYFPLRKPGVLVGRGDDCALLPAGKPLSISSDLFLEDVHFRTSYATAEEIGHKALAVNVSDIAACGGRREMIQGTAKAAEETLKEAFKRLASPEQLCGGALTE